MAHPLLRRNRWTRLSRSLRTEWRARGVNCHLCGRPIRPEQAMDVDHIVPVTVAPHRAYDLTNLAPAHASCNRSKQDRTDDLETAVKVKRPTCAIAGEPVLATTRRWFGAPGTCLREDRNTCPRDCPAHAYMERLDARG